MGRTQLRLAGCLTLLVAAAIIMLGASYPATADRLATEAPPVVHRTLNSDTQTLSMSSEDLRYQQVQERGVDDLEQRRHQYIRSSGLGETLLPPVRVGHCEVSLHRQTDADPTWSLVEQEQPQGSPMKWFVFSDEADDTSQSEPSVQTFRSQPGEWPESLREEMGDLPPPRLEPPAIGDIWAVTICPDGNISQGGPVDVGLGFTSWESGAAIYGLLPPGAESIRVTRGEEAIPVHVRQGLFLAAIPTGADVTVTFRGPQGQILEEHRLEADWIE